MEEENIIADCVQYLSIGIRVQLQSLYTVYKYLKLDNTPMCGVGWTKHSWRNSCFFQCCYLIFVKVWSHHILLLKDKTRGSNLVRTLHNKVTQKIVDDFLAQIEVSRNLRFILSKHNDVLNQVSPCFLRLTSLTFEGYLLMYRERQWLWGNFCLDWKMVDVLEAIRIVR